jgi:hypothetical protein
MVMSAQFLAAIQIPQAAATLRGIRREVGIMRHGAFGEPLRLGCAAYLSRSTRFAGQLAAPYRAQSTIKLHPVISVSQTFTSEITTLEH